MPAPEPHTVAVGRTAARTARHSPACHLTSITPCFSSGYVAGVRRRPFAAAAVRRVPSEQSRTRGDRVSSVVAQRRAMSCSSYTLLARAVPTVSIRDTPSQPARRSNALVAAPAFGSLWRARRKRDLAAVETSSSPGSSSSSSACSCWGAEAWGWPSSSAASGQNRKHRRKRPPRRAQRLAPLRLRLILRRSPRRHAPNRLRRVPRLHRRSIFPRTRRRLRTCRPLCPHHRHRPPNGRCLLAPTRLLRRHLPNHSRGRPIPRRNRRSRHPQRLGRRRPRSTG